MTFKDELLIDVKEVFVAPNEEFDEVIVYATPPVLLIESGLDFLTEDNNNLLLETPVARSINAQVIRDAFLTTGEAKNEVLHNQVEILIANDADAGITKVDKVNDRVTLIDREGNTKTGRPVRVIYSDTAIWHLLIQWGK